MTTALRNGHQRDEVSVARHMASLAELPTLAKKIVYACDRHGPDVTTGEIRTWLARHGVPTKDSQRPYVSAAVNDWRREQTVAVQHDRPRLAMPNPADERPLTDLDRPTDVVSPAGKRAQDASTEPAGAYGFYAVAALSLTVSVDTSWRFFAIELAITNTWERTAMFAVLEAALIACGFGMRAGVRRSGRPGPARFWVWALCGLAGYMALVLSGPVVGLARVALGPALGLVMLHLALGIEIRAGAHRTGTWARVGRELRERALSRVGLADDERDALARTRDRAARRVARLSLGRFVPGRSSRLARALRVSNVAHDPAARARMLNELAARRHAGELATLDQRSPWTERPDRRSAGCNRGSRLNDSPTTGRSLSMNIEPMSQPEPPTPPPAASSWRQPWVWILVAVIAVAIGVATILEVISRPTPANDHAGRPAAAERTCRGFVDERLKAPASAKYGQPTTAFAAGDTADFYTVTGTVDSENSFGAMLRNHYTCKLTAERDGTWRLTDLTFSGR